MKNSRPNLSKFRSPPCSSDCCDGIPASPDLSDIFRFSPRLHPLPPISCECKGLGELIFFKRNTLNNWLFRTIFLKK